MNLSEMSEISRSVTILLNEKIRQEKEKKPKKKKQTAKKFDRSVLEEDLIEDKYPNQLRLFLMRKFAKKKRRNRQPKRRNRQPKNLIEVFGKKT
jgi:hypothetical protein